MGLGLGYVVLLRARFGGTENVELISDLHLLSEVYYLTNECQVCGALVGFGWVIYAAWVGLWDGD